MPLRRPVGLFALCAMVPSLLALMPATASADTVAQPLPFSQDWSSASLITTNNDWSGVPGITGYRGDGLASTNTDPRTITADGAATPVNVLAQSSATSTTGAVHEIEASQVVALQGSGTADAPHLVVRVDSTDATGIEVGYLLRDLDADNGGAQQVALQYRVGGSGVYTDVPDGYTADASGASGDTFPVSATLPAAADDQPVVDIRIITTDTTGSDSMTGVDDLSVTSGGSPGGPASPVATCPDALDVEQGSAGSADVSATDADSQVVSGVITSTPVAGISLDDFTASAADGGPATGTLTVADTTEVGEYDVVVEFGTDDDPAQTATCTVAVTVVAPAQPVLISEVQGSGPASPIEGTDVVVEAVVTSLFERGDVLDGFFLQEQDADADADPATSEGVFVFCRGVCPTELAAGDLVQATGTVDEFFGMTQLDVTDGSTTTMSNGDPLPTPATVALPAAGSTRAESTFESVEGMVVSIPTTLAVSEYFQQARFGTLTLAAGERPYQFTQLNAPSESGNAAYLAELDRSRILLDDDNNDNNDAISGPDADEPYAYPSPGLSVDDRLRGGDTITDLTGVMHWSFSGASGTDAWRIRPIPTESYVFDRVNERTAAPATVGGTLTVASFNVLNYFADIDDESGDICGPTGGAECRGADSPAELERQQAKIVAALAAIDADVFGLIEIQNDEGASAQQLVNALNAATGEQYAALDTGTIGTDAIKQAYLYKTDTVEPVGDPVTLTSAEDPRFDDGANRPALIQTFEQTASGELITIANNHFKSKGSGCGEDDDATDGSGNCDGTRTRAAAALVDFLASDPTGTGEDDTLIIGDLNSYATERPITTIEAAGYTDLAQRFEGQDSYGYLFDGQLGSLDYALAGASLNSQVTGTTVWNINADEPVLFDYNDAVFDAPGEPSFERESRALPLYAPDAYRSSDHDPVIVGLDLNTAPVADAGGPYQVAPGRTVALDAGGSSDANGDPLTFVWDLDGDGAFDDATGSRVSFRGNRPPGSYPVAVQVSDGRKTSTDSTVVDVVPPGRARGGR